MAEENTQELTPEEKLLEVIQKGEQLSQEAPSAKPAADLDADDDLIAGAPVPVTSGGPISLSAISRLLVVLCIALIGVSGYEMYLNLPEPEGELGSAAIEFSGGGETLVLASLSDTLDLFSKRRILGKVPRPVYVTQTVVDQELLKGWRAYARDNFKLMGTSEVQRQGDAGVGEQVLEAIVMDTKEKKMHFLTSGKKLAISKQDVVVGDVGESSVEFVVGEDRLTIE
jgi:hypothetical protein